MLLPSREPSLTSAPPGLAQYAATLKYLSRSEATASRPIFIPLQPNISMQLFSPSHLRPASLENMTRDLKTAFKDLGFTSCDVLGHSNGTIVAGWIIKAMGDFVKKTALVDPVCFCLYQPDVCYNFLYAEANSGVDIFLRCVSALSSHKSRC